MTPIALVIGVAFLALWLIGGYFAPDYAVGANKRGLYWLGLILVALWFPLYAWRKAEDKKAGTTFYNRLTAATKETSVGGS